MPPVALQRTQPFPYTFGVEVLSTLRTAPCDVGIIITGVGLRGNGSGNDGVSSGFGGGSGCCGDQIFATN